MKRALLFAFAVTVVKCSFEIYWNVPDHICPNNRVEDYGIIVNEGHKFDGEKIVIFYEEQLGLVPFCAHEKSDKKCYSSTNECRYPRNGGVPQNADLNAHLKKVVLDVELLIPNRDFDGIAVIDYECWRPIYEYNYGGRSVYQKYSIELIREKYGINDTSAERLARYEFNSAAKRFFIETLKLAKRLRPFAKWGYWEYPLCNYDAGYDGKTDCLASFRVYNEQLLDLMAIQDVLFPRVYFSSNRRENHTNSKQTIARMKEALRTNMLTFQARKPIYAYVKFAYGEDEEFYSAEDICNSFHLPLLLGADGAIVWSGSKNMQKRCDSIAAYVQDMFGPYSSAFLSMSRRCSVHHCNGHGLCTNLRYAEKLESCTFAIPTQVFCKCDDGYYGRYCQESIYYNGREVQKGLYNA
ncbi:unnamed protein product [Bursaphelenchus xylophilus]|uniref:Hyaluronidase n=1 Tax=Bursaphelenchus xylophilus TaxID=6326 RepID=A0A1I7SBP0_BURXY|nr:unnamed protein product [Bursaphelenchus xylophilus]CAG9114530.1 unnamed protein product [Bursaphelenchus xylophilus]